MPQCMEGVCPKKEEATMQTMLERQGFDPAQDADQRIDRKLTVIHDQYFHSFTPCLLTQNNSPLLV